MIQNHLATTGIAVPEDWSYSATLVFVILGFGLNIGAQHLARELCQGERARGAMAWSCLSPLYDAPVLGTSLWVVRGVVYAGTARGLEGTANAWALTLTVGLIGEAAFYLMLNAAVRQVRGESLIEELRQDGFWATFAAVPFAAISMVGATVAGHIILFAGDVAAILWKL